MRFPLLILVALGLSGCVSWFHSDAYLESWGNSRVKGGHYPNYAELNIGGRYDVFEQGHRFPDDAPLLVILDWQPCMEAGLPTANKDVIFYSASRTWLDCTCMRKIGDIVFRFRLNIPSLLFEGDNKRYVLDRQNHNVVVIQILPNGTAKAVWSGNRKYRAGCELSYEGLFHSLGYAYPERPNQSK